MPGLGNRKNSIDISTVKKRNKHPAALLNASSLGSGVNESQKKIQPFVCCCLEEGFSAFPEPQGESQKMGFCRMQKAVSHCKPQWCAKAIWSQMKLVFLPASKLSADTRLKARMIPNRDLIFTISESNYKELKNTFIIFFLLFILSIVSESPWLQFSAVLRTAATELTQILIGLAAPAEDLLPSNTR